MSIVLALAGIVARRMLGNWRLLTAVAVGVIVAVALMSSTAIYTDALDDLGLNYALRQRQPVEMHLQIDSNYQSARSEEYQQLRQTVEGALARRVGWLVEDTARYGRSATFYLTPVGQPVPAREDRPRAFFQFMTELSQHTRLVEGRAPAAVATSPAGAPKVEVLLGRAAAEALNVRVGDTFDLHPFWRDDLAPIQVVVSGLLEPLDPLDEFWLNRDDLFYYPSSNWDTYPFFVSDEVFLNVLARYLNDLTADFSFLAYLDTGRLNARNADAAKGGIDSLNAELAFRLPRTTAITALPEVIQEYKDKLFFSSLPVLVLILQVVGIVLYYLVMVSTMLVERQAGEIALLKSRGAGSGQVMAVYAAEGLVLAALGVGLGPPLAAAVTSLLGKTPAFRDLSGGDLLAVNLSVRAYLLALGGALLAFASLLWPAYRAARYSIVQYKQSVGRPPATPLFLRYYLDVFLVVAGGLIFWELRQRGSLVTEDLFGGREADPLLLLSPVVFLVAVAIVFLRLFPLLLRLVAWAVSRFQGAATALGLWHLVRTPVHHTRLILLLMLATGLGMFAATFSATLNRSYRERALYQAGSPLRLEEVRNPGVVSRQRFAEAFQELPGAAIVSPAVRERGSLSPPGSFSSYDLTVLGVDPETFPQVAWFRDDLAGRPLSQVLEPLKANGVQEPGLALPADAHHLGVWVVMPEPTERVVLMARLQDAQGRYWDLILGDYRYNAPPPREWQFTTADLMHPVSAFGKPLPGPPPSPPLRLQSLYLRTAGRLAAIEGSVYLDDLQVSRQPAEEPSLSAAGFADGLIIEDFEDIDEWQGGAGAAGLELSDTFSRSTIRVHGGSFAGHYRWSEHAPGISARGIRLRGDDSPLLIIADRRLLDRAGLHKGDIAQLYIQGQYIPVQIAGSFALFPTFDARQSSGFVLAHIDRLLYYLNRDPGGMQPIYANEAWLTLQQRMRPQTLQAIAQGDFEFDELYDLEEIMFSQETDPLVAAGWQGILFISFLAILILTALGFLVYSYLTAQTRTLEFAVLRTIGLSRAQIAGVVGLEQLFVIGTGIAAGTLLGIQLGRLMLDYVGITETGEEVLPPFVLGIDWGTIGSTYAVLALVFIATIAVVVLLYARLAIARTLRLGEL